MSLLYEHNMHSEIKDVFEVVKSKKSGNPVFVKTLSNIVLASCYKQVGRFTEFTEHLNIKIG